MPPPPAPRYKILHVVATLDAGGTEMWALRLVEHWRHDVSQRVIVLDRSSGILEPAFARAAPLEILDGPGKAMIFRAVRAAAKEMAADAVLIHCFGLHQVAAALAARSLGIRSIAGSAGNPPPAAGSGRAKWAAAIALSRLAGCPVAGCSHAVHAQLAGLGAGMPAGSFAIPYGIDLDGGAVARPGMAADGSTRIAMVARLDTIKDHRTLIAAFALVVTRQPKARLQIIGDGPLRGEVEALATELGVAHAVDFMGRRADVADLLRDANIFVLSTTRDEGFGIVLIEAMVAGLPIIASAVPACREVLADGAAGVLVAAGDAAAMADAIATMIERPAVAADYAARGRARVASEYSIEACAARWLTILELAPFFARKVA